MSNRNHRSKQSFARSGSALATVLMIMIIMMLIGMSLIKISEGAAVQASLVENEQIAMLTAEAACENALYWMSGNPDLLLDMDISGTSGSFQLPNARADYDVQFYGFIGYRPVFEVTANGYSGSFHRSIRVHVAQAVSGWEMGMCRIPSGPGSTDEVYFADGEVIDMPIHINSYGRLDDSNRDIYISGNPVFLEEVSMEESRYSSNGWDKYGSVMDVFHGSISFDQPKSLITDEESIDKKIQWYRDTVLEQKPNLVFTPQKNNTVPEAQEAVQLEFLVTANGKGCVRVTDDCTVRGYTASGYSSTLDYKVRLGNNGTNFERYPIYAYHYIPENAEASGKRVSLPIADIQISADYGVVESPPCGMIFVDGNVVIGSASENSSDSQISALNIVQGKVSVIATGNIWIANTLTVSDRDDAGNYYPRQDDGMPALDNPNGIGLFAQGVIKVLDPGLVEDYAVSTPGHWESAPGYWETIPGHWETIPGHWEGRGWWRTWVPEQTVWVPEETVWVDGGWVWVAGTEGVPTISGMEYEPIANKESGHNDWDYHRYLPDPMVVEAAMTVGGGGWGAENVDYPGGRKTSGYEDDLIVRGTLTEVIRGVVGIIGRNGYQKKYYYDERMMSGLIPGTVRLKGKFVTVPGGWSDFRVDQKPDD